MIRFKKEIRACTTAFARLGDERCGFPRPRLPNSSTSNIATLAWLIRSLPSRHLERQCTHRLRDGVSGSSAVRASIQWFFRFNHWGADQKLAPFLDGRGVSSALKSLQDRLSPVSTPKELQRVELLNYTKANGDELVGLAVELAEDPSGGVQVRVLMDSNVVSGVTVVPLQQGGCCD